MYIVKEDIIKHIALLRENISKDYSRMFRDAGKAFKYPFLVPGSQQYDDVLWDWDSWLSNVALRQVLLEEQDEQKNEEALKYEKGCVLNYLSWCDMDGWMPIFVGRDTDTASMKPGDIYAGNMHKPCIAQHAAFIVRNTGGDAEWLRDKFYYMQAFINKYRNHQRHRCGLYFWVNDLAIGVDNDPCTFFRPDRSSGSIYLNCLMLKELEAMVYLSQCLNLEETAEHYRKDYDELLTAIREYCWDERDGFYYSVDLNLKDNQSCIGLHRGMPRDWDCLIMRIGVWSGFMAMWSGAATEQQAERMVKEHFQNKKTFNADFGIRTLSKMEKMYNVRASGNPSSWLGPVWGISNYLTFKGLARYGFNEEARELAIKTISLFGRDIERFGALHEYYEPDNGEPILNRGFQNWNYLVLNMAAWLEGRDYITEF